MSADEGVRKARACAGKLGPPRAGGRESAR